MDNAISFARSSVEHLERTGRAQGMSPEELQNFAANAVTRRADAGVITGLPMALSGLPLKTIGGGA